MIKNEEQRRIREEILAAGVTKYHLHKNEAKYLPKIIHKDEHVQAAVNGRNDLGSVMLVATNKRIIFLDCKSFYATVDELTYDVVSGVMYHVQGLFAHVILHTRIGDYNLRFVNIGQAKRFVSYIESKRLEVPDTRTLSEGPKPIFSDTPVKAGTLNRSAKLFLHTHVLGVLSTTDRTGNVSGAAVYYIVDEKNQIYVLTKSDTQKARNVRSHHQVAMTIYDEFDLKTLQIEGIAYHESDTQVVDRVVGLITQPRQFGNKVVDPPVTKLREGSYVVLKIVTQRAKLADYND